MKQRLIESSFQQRSLSIFAKKQWLRIFVFQLIGTAILAFGVCCTFYKIPLADKVPNTVMMHDLYISLSLYLSICLFAPFTGGHFNPAVSLGVFLNRKGGSRMKISTLGVYILAQFVGAAVGSGFSKLTYDIGAGPFDSQTVYSFYDIAVRFAGETIGTCLFVLMILIVTTESTTFITQDCWIHLFIPMCLYGGRKLSKYVRALNPAVVIVLQLITFFGEQNSKFLHVGYVLLLGLAQLLGATLAALFFNFLYSKTLQKWRGQQY